MCQILLTENNAEETQNNAIHLGGNLLFSHTQSTKNLIKFLCDFVYEVSLQVKTGHSSLLCTGRNNTNNVSLQQKSGFYIKTF